jgi:PAS domain-containing protein
MRSARLPILIIRRAHTREAEHRVRNEATSTEPLDRRGALPDPRENHQTLDTQVLAALSLPIWVLDLARFAALAGQESECDALHRCFLDSAVVLCVNPAAIAFHQASHASELLGSLDRVFRPDAVRWIVRAVNGSRDAAQREHIALGALDGSTRRARARFDTIATDRAAPCLALTLLPDPPRSNLLGIIPDLAFELDANGIYVDFAGLAEDAFVAPGEFLGKSITETMPPDVAHRALAALQRTREHGGNERFEYALSMSDGLHWYEARMSALPSGGAAAYVRDITEQKSAEWRYQESEQRLRALDARVRARTLELEAAKQELEALRLAQRSNH